VFAGLFGSLVDSLLGATVQQTRYSRTKKLVLQDDSKDIDAVNVISGRNLLTNNQVSHFFWVQQKPVHLTVYFLGQLGLEHVLCTRSRVDKWKKLINGIKLLFVSVVRTRSSWIQNRGNMK
jgi:hypothetical protein